jgi:hypothetical protein
MFTFAVSLDLNGALLIAGTMLILALCIMGGQPMRHHGR